MKWWRRKALLHHSNRLPTASWNQRLWGKSRLSRQGWKLLGVASCFRHIQRFIWLFEKDDGLMHLHAIVLIPFFVLNTLVIRFQTTFWFWLVQDYWSRKICSSWAAAFLIDQDQFVAFVIFCASFRPLTWQFACSSGDCSFCSSLLFQNLEARRCRSRPPDRGNWRNDSVFGVCLGRLRQAFDGSAWTCSIFCLERSVLMWSSLPFLVLKLSIQTRSLRRSRRFLTPSSFFWTSFSLKQECQRISERDCL